MATKLIHLLVALASAAAVSVALDVTVYYESLCPDSLNFFRTQLNPVLNNTALKKHLKPTFVPWGHANVTNDSSISCQHGPVECDGNRLQACALNKITQPDVLAAYIGCLMSLNVSRKTTPVYPQEQCKEAAGTFYDDVLTCYADNELSTNYLKALGAQTDAMFNHTKFGVPYVTFNNNYKRDDDLSNKAVSNFKSVVCKNLKSENLEECSSSASKLAATLIPTMILFFFGRM